MALTVIGVFDNATEAQQAVNQLVNAGFSRDQVDLSTQAASGTYETGMRNVASDQGEADGTSSFFDSLFGNDTHDARRYAHVAGRSSVVTVHAQTEEQAERAADLLDDNGAVNVDERAAQYGYTQPNATTTPTTGDQSFKVIEENLQVGKQTVETGGVRLRSRIIERPVEEHLRLRQERVVVQRTPVDRPISTADFNTFKEGEITLTEHAERAVVAKEARVVEEVVVGKTVEEHDEVIRDTVRRTDVDIEQIVPGQTSTTRPESTGDDVTYATT